MLIYPCRFVAILLEPISDDDGRPSFLNRALALNSNLPFGCEKLQMADRSLMHMRTHDRFDVWIASSTRDSRSLSPPPTYKLLRLMTPGAQVDKAVFHEPDVRDNQYAVQVHNDLVNGLLGSIGLNSDEVHLLPGTDPRNAKLFFTELNEEQVNTVVSQFGSKPRFQIQPVEWYRGANLTNMAAVYEVCSSRYLVFNSECPVSVRPSSSLLGPNTWIFTGDCACRTPGIVQNIARTEAYSMGDHVSLCVFLIRWLPSGPSSRT